MQKKIVNFLKTELASAVFFIIVGLFLAFFPVQTVNVICKVVFGLLLILTGLYNIILFLMEKTETTVFNMLSGVIVLVLGLFLFTNPQIVVRLLPQLLGSLILIDSIWLLRSAKRLRKSNSQYWTAFLITGLVCVILGLIILVNPFSKVKQTVIFSGVVFLINGIVDIVFYMILKKNGPKTEENGEGETSLSVEGSYSGHENSAWSAPGDHTSGSEFKQDEDHLEEWKD